MQNDEKKLPVRNLERIAEKNGFTSFEAADVARSLTKVEGATKAKVFARWTGTYDLVWYGPIKAAKVDKVEETKPAEPKVHGLTAKQRRAKEKK
jgi:hypothetical protein